MSLRPFRQTRMRPSRLDRGVLAGPSGPEFRQFFRVPKTTGRDQERRTFLHYLFQGDVASPAFSLRRAMAVRVYVRASCCQGLPKLLPRWARTRESRGAHRGRDPRDRPSEKPRPRFVSSGAWRERSVRLALRGPRHRRAVGRTVRRRLPRRPRRLWPHADLDGVARGSGPLVWLRPCRGPPPVSGEPCNRRLRRLLGRHAREPRAAGSQSVIGRPADRSPGRSLRPSSAARAQGILDRRSPVSGDECLQAVRRAEPRQHDRRGHRHFRDAFEARRSRGMRGDVDATGWNDLYRLAINTRPEGLSAVVSLGSPISHD